MCDLFDDTRGLAMLEGAVLAPILVTVLIGMVYLQRTYTAALDSRETVRSCAWAYAAAGCQGPEELPAQCPKPETAAGSGHFRPFLLGAEGTSEETSKQLESAGDGALDGALGALDGLSDVALAFMGLRDELELEVTDEVKRPSLFGGGTARVRASYAVMCNEIDLGVWEFLDAAVENVL